MEWEALNLCSDAPYAHPGYFDPPGVRQRASAFSEWRVCTRHVLCTGAIGLLLRLRRPCRCGRHAGRRRGAVTSVPARDIKARESELSCLTVQALKELCRQRSLKVSGLKAAIVRRIVDSEIEADAEVEEEQQEEWNEVAAEEAGADDLGARLANSSQPTPIAEIFKRADISNIFGIEPPAVGSIVSGVVTSVVDFGAFVKLRDSGRTGLLHVAEISDEFVSNIEECVQPGDHITCMVIPGHDERQDRLSLSMRRMPVQDEAEGVAPIANYSPKKDVLVEQIERLQARLGAIESVVKRIGHGDVLRAAQEDSRIGMMVPAVPPSETLLGGLDEPEEECVDLDDDVVGIGQPSQIIAHTLSDILDGDEDP